MANHSHQYPLVQWAWAASARLSARAGLQGEANFEVPLKVNITL
jgi:hypothetical protein